MAMNCSTEITEKHSITFICVQESAQDEILKSAVEKKVIGLMAQ